MMRRIRELAHSSSSVGMMMSVSGGGTRRMCSVRCVPRLRSVRCLGLCWTTGLLLAFLPAQVLAGEPVDAMRPNWARDLVIYEVATKGFTSPDGPESASHPDWFKGGSWGMTNYDWRGEHPDLEEWWVQMWTKAALEWGVDGFRCDCGVHRPDLWLEIKRRCTVPADCNPGGGLCILRFELAQ